MNTDFLLQGHLNDLANKAYQKNIYTFTNFLSASDLDIFYSMLPIFLIFHMRFSEEETAATA